MHLQNSIGCGWMKLGRQGGRQVRWLAFMVHFDAGEASIGSSIKESLVH